MDPDRRHKTPGSKSKYMVPHSSYQSISIFLFQFPEPQFPRTIQRELRDTCTHSVMYCGNPIFYKDNKHACSLFQKDTLSLSSKAVCYTNTMEKIAPNKLTQCLYLQDMQETKGELSSNTGSLFFNLFLPGCIFSMKLLN